MATRNLATQIVSSLEDDVVYPFMAVEMLFDESSLRLWTGLGELNFGGNVWVGAGELLSISTVQETSDIVVRGADLTLSAIPSNVVSLALSEPYQGRVCNIYFGMFSRGSALQESGDFILLEDGSKILLEDQSTGLSNIFSGYMDEMNIEEAPDTATIELKVENKLIDLERQRVRRYTSAYQKSKFPGDKGFDFVEDLQDKRVVWGRNSKDK